MKWRKIIAVIFAFASISCATFATSNMSKNDMQERWKELSDQEKSEVYEILDERAQTEIALLEKYVQLGLLNEKEAREIQNKIEERMESAKEKGLFPGAGKGPREEGRKKSL